MEQYNLDLSYRVLLHLYYRGARHFCVAPGSRSAPLVFALRALQASYPDTKIHSHFDERGMAFFGLGLAKATNSPVALITTSGTAVANMLPAIIEAAQTQVPLIALTADRPDELLDCGANQAIDQKYLFGSYPANHVLLPAPEPTTTVDTVDGIMENLPGTLKGPVHINCAFREPLYSDSLSPGTEWQKPVTVPPLSDSGKSWNLPKISEDCVPLIIIGNLPEQESLMVFDWATECGFAVTCDLTSGISLSAISKLSFNADLLLASKSGQNGMSQFSLVIQFGGYLTSKRLQTWLQAQSTDYWLVSPNGTRLDPTRRAVQITAPVASCINYWHQPSRTDTTTNIKANNIKASLPDIPDWSWSELAVARSLASMIGLDCNLFIGNSLSVRWFNCFPMLSASRLSVFTNRGASGIDGLIATTAGIAKSGIKPTVAVIGDISALHDMNSLALINDTPGPLVLIIINNGGGNIFNLLPAANHPDINSRFFRTDHSWQFEHIANQFRLSYYQPDSLKTLHQCLNAQLSNNQGCIIECRFPEGEASSLYQDWQKSVAEQ